jgi:hypothetical protein
LAIVVGEHPLEREAAARLLAAARPDQLWGVVDPRTTVADTRRWLSSLSDEYPVTALAVVGAYDAVEPASVLGLGVPVGLLDGVPATRVAWAAAFSQYIDEADNWAG